MSAGMSAWEQCYWDVDDYPEGNNKAQGIDWIYKTDNINEDEAMRIQTRGLFLRTLSHGDGDNTTDDFLHPYDQPQLLGVALAADGREYLAQTMAYSESAVDATLRSAELLSRSVRTTQGQIRHTDNTLLDKVFNTTGVTWGDTSDETVGTYHIDDEEVMDQLVSSNMVGNRLSYILYGSMRHRGHRLAILQAKASIVPKLEYGRRIDRRV